MAVIVDPGFWAGRRVFVTGHTGFKGGWLSLWLQALGAQVTGYALAPDGSPGLFDVASVGAAMRSHIGDVRDADALAGALAAADPEVVFHLAAQPLVRASYRDPVGNYATNVMGTVHLLHAARTLPALRALVVVTTDKVYENREWLWPYREDEALGGRDPYSSSKACAELVTAAYRDSFLAEAGCGVATARAGNVVGGGDWAEDRLVPDLLRGFAAGAPVPIRNPAAVRPWQHVLEPLSGYLLLAERLWREPAAAAAAWNFGPVEADAEPVGRIAARLAERWGDGARCVPDPGPHPHEARLLRLDSARAQALLGWQPRWPLAETLDRIVAWHRAWSAGADMRAFSLSQIADFAASAQESPQ